MAVSSPAVHRQADPVQRPHRRRPGIHLGHLVQLEHRRRLRRPPGLSARRRSCRRHHDALPGGQRPGHLHQPVGVVEDPRPSPARSAGVPSGPTTSTTYPPGACASSAVDRHREHRSLRCCGGDVHRHRRLVQGPGRRRVGQRHRHRDRGAAASCPAWWSPPCPPRTPRPAWSPRPAASRHRVPRLDLATAGRRRAEIVTTCRSDVAVSTGPDAGPPRLPVTWADPQRLRLEHHLPQRQVP